LKFQAVAQNTEEKELGFLFWRKGAIGATLYLPRSAFVAGEAIPISALIANESSRSISRTQVELRMVRAIWLNYVNNFEK
jgi:hypothetical protein